MHDFGLYRYDPQKLRFIKPTELPLYPEGAQVGREIRVIGNDAGEQLSILAGTLARLDRDAPELRHRQVQRLQYVLSARRPRALRAAPPARRSSTSRAASSRSMLAAAPAQRRVSTCRSRACSARSKLIQEGKPVARGTLQTVFQYTPYDEVRRLGLQPETEAECARRFPNLTGMLVVTEVQPGSPSEGVLEPGDVLVRVNGQPVAEFNPLEQVLDENVGNKVELEVAARRHTGQDGAASAGSAFDHASSLPRIRRGRRPRAFLSAGATLQHAGTRRLRRQSRLRIWLGAVPRGAVIPSVNGKPMATLADFEASVTALGEGERATVRFFTLDDPNAVSSGA